MIDEKDFSYSSDFGGFNNIDMQFRVVESRNTFGFRVILFADTPTNASEDMYICKDIIMKRVRRGDATDESCSFLVQRPEALDLIKRFKQLHVSIKDDTPKPTDAEIQALKTEIDKLERHLEDMRTLLFKYSVHEKEYPIAPTNDVLNEEA